MPDQPQYTELNLTIAGERIGADRRSGEDVLDPATGRPIAHLPHATPEDLDRALAAADVAFRAWRETTAVERAKVLRRAADLIRERADRIARVLTLEEGKPLRESHAELTLSVETLDWLADEGRRTYGRVIPGHTPQARVLVVREPVGPVAAFTPWNFPALTAIRKVGAALASGCSIVLKAAEETPGTAVELVRAFDDAGLPPGTLQLVFGVPSEVSGHLLDSEVIRKISFTGSIPVGTMLAARAASTMKRFTMELGGHAPVLVFADADLERTVPLVAGFKYRNAGQVCVAPTRFYVEEAVHERFVDAMVAHAADLSLGNGLDEATTMGPLANERRLHAMEDFLADARDHGATVATGGERVGDEGFFFRPTVVTDISDDARLMREEPFGPVAAITPFGDVEEALARANSLPYGLAAYCYTSSERTARLVSSRLEAGLVAVNTATVSLPQAPFGGVKMSGDGKEGGSEGIDAYLLEKLIVQE